MKEDCITIEKYRDISQKDYANISGPDWPSYEDFLSAESLPEFIINELETMVGDLTPIEICAGDNREYQNFLEKEYFHVVKNLAVLEIGPHHGFHTNLIGKMQPKFHEVIEPDPVCVDFWRKNYSKQITIIQDDVFQVLQKNKKTDVVICFGVLYHLHSPLYLLELIANNCDPNIILLDCVHSPDVLQFLEEKLNVSGSRFSINSWKSANFNLVAPFEIISQSMKQLGYKLVKGSKLSIKDSFSKNNSWIGMWEKIRRKE